MNAILDLLKIILPAVLVMLAMYFTIQSFLKKEFERRLAEIKLKGTEVLLNSRLQAYERMALFLERIIPANMLVRLNASELNAPELHTLMLFEIRNEFSHNLSQQVYMSDSLWTMIQNAKEEITVLLNNAIAGFDESHSGLDFAKKVFELMHEHQLDPARPALISLKEEVQTLF